MTDQKSRRAPRRGRARQRAIRAHAARTGVAYSVAARQIESLGLRPHETVASYGRTIYPTGLDDYRRRLVAARAARSAEERLADARHAALLPAGRADHLVDRFPPFRAHAGDAGQPDGLELYGGVGRADLLAMLYVTVAVELPALVPELTELAWAAEMGEETAVDVVCGDLDRAVRVILERSPDALQTSLAQALALAVHSSELSLRSAARRLVALDWPADALDGARQILDAVLMVADDGHAPGTRVRVVVSPHEGTTATIVGALWGVSGPPVAYRIRLDDPPLHLTAGTGELIVLADQESIPG